MKYFLLLIFSMDIVFASSIDKAIELENAGNFEAARKEYGNIIQKKNISDFVMQEVVLRYAKLSFEELKKQYPEKSELKKYVSELIFPLINYGKKINGSADSLLKLNELDSEVKIYLDLDSTIFFNGKKFKSNKENFIFSQLFGQNTNIAPIEGHKIKKSSNHDFFSESYIKLAGEDLFIRRLILGSEINGNIIRYFNRKDSSIFQNDSTDITALFEGDFLLDSSGRNDHIIASWQTNKKYMDYQAKFNKKSYSSVASYKIGYSKRFFSFGVGNIEYIASDSDNVSSTYKYDAKEFKFTQSFENVFENKINFEISYKDYIYLDSRFNSKDFKFSGMLKEWIIKDDLMLNSSIDLILSSTENRSMESSIKFDNYVYRKWLDNIYFAIDLNLYKSISKVNEYKVFKGEIGLSTKVAY